MTLHQRPYAFVKDNGSVIVTHDSLLISCSACILTCLHDRLVTAVSKADQGRISPTTFKDPLAEGLDMVSLARHGSRICHST